MTTTSTRDEMIKVLVFPFNIVFMTLLDAFQQQLTVSILTTPNCPVKMMMVQKCNIFINDPKTIFLNIERPQNPGNCGKNREEIGKKFPNMLLNIPRFALGATLDNLLFICCHFDTFFASFFDKWDFISNDLFTVLQDNY
jgi:hypothetical protein